MLLLRFLTALLFSGFAHAAPPPDHPSTQQATALLGLSSDVQTQFVGRVMQTHDSNNYSYIQVESLNGESQWLAAPKLDLPVGSHIGYGQGALMQDFYSKKLQRHFPQILFVSGVRLLK